LVERYNRALKRTATGRGITKVFHVDISGYSPEVGDEFDDPLYLNHQGVNRQFILVTTDPGKCAFAANAITTCAGS
jgi:hypothetical protein